jgi:lysophospholipase L1-like esterase
VTGTRSAFVRKLLLVVLATAFALAVAEGAVRLLGLAPEVTVIQKGRYRLSLNPRLGYEPVPGVDHQGENLSYFDYMGASNSLGFRDREHPREKPTGTWRVVVLGDSIAAGLRVERFEDTLPPLLEDRLRGAGVPAEVISLAVSGYNTSQEVETLREKGLGFEPDLVVVAYSLTDRERVDGDVLTTLLAEERGGGLSHTRVHPLLSRSALVRAVRYRLLPPPELDPTLARGYEELLAGTDTVAESFAELADLGRRHGFSVLVAVFPRMPRRFAAYPFADQHAWVARQAARHGFEVVDLLPAFDRCGGGRSAPLKIDHFHPSPAGHRCAAEAIAEVVVEELDPPRE